MGTCDRRYCHDRVRVSRLSRAAGDRRAVNAPIFGVIVLQLIIGGILYLIIALVLALRARPIWIIDSGAVLLCADTGPLVVVGVTAKLGLTADPNPNPVAFGMLALFTLIPALVLLMWGFVNWRLVKGGSP
jgi:hypothetical protein